MRRNGGPLQVVEGRRVDRRRGAVDDGPEAAKCSDDACDKVVLGDALDLTLRDLQVHPQFDLEKHGKKWIAASFDWQPFHWCVDPGLWDAPVGRDLALKQ